MHITTNGIVLREVTYKESDKILTILTEENGKLTATARGCRKKGSLFSASSQQLIWSEFVLYEYRGKWAVKEANLNREFHIQHDFKRFSLACYMAQVTELLALEDLSQPPLLSLLLNCLHILEKQPEIPPPLVKAVFELRATCISGYEPILDSCSFCNSESPTSPQFNLQGGTIHCHRCGGKSYPFTDSTLSALRYIANCPDKKIFSFTLSPTKALESICEAYLLTQLDHHFPSLDFYKKYNS